VRLVLEILSGRLAGQKKRILSGDCVT